MNDLSPSASADERTSTAAYRLWVDERVRFADLDPLGHANNKAFLTYAESGRAGFLFKTGLWELNGRRNVVARVEIDYLGELLYPAELRVGVRVLAVGRSSFTLGIGIFSGETCAAVAVTVLVRIDGKTRTKVALDDEERARLEAYRTRPGR